MSQEKDKFARNNYVSRVDEANKLMEGSGVKLETDFGNWTGQDNTLTKTGYALKVQSDWAKLGYSEQVLNSTDSDGRTLREKMDKLASDLVNAKTEVERGQVIINATKGDGHLQPLVDAAGIAKLAVNKLVEGSTHDPARNLTLHSNMQGGDTRGLAQQSGLHTPTMAEIVANAKKSSQTGVIFDTNSGNMRQIDPLAPHFDLSGEVPRPVSPLKPGPKISGNG